MLSYDLAVVLLALFMSFIVPFAGAVYGVYFARKRIYDKNRK